MLSTTVSNNAGPSVEKRAPSAPGKGSDMPFHKVADCFEGLYRADNRDRRLQLLRKLWKRHGRPDMHPLMRLMLPGMDTKRPNYHLKEKMLAQLYISMLGLPPDSESAKELISWKRPSALSRASAGDFPEKAFAVIESRCPSAESLGPRRVTIADMNALLEEPWTRGPRAEQTCPGHVVDVSIRSSPLRTAPPRSRPVGSRS